MNTDSPISPWRAAAARLRRGALWVIFALVLMIPKVIRLRRQRRAWNLVRILMAFAGAAMLTFGAARGHALALLVAGVLMLLFALLLTPARSEFSSASSIDARARELGALITVDGVQATAEFIYEGSFAEHPARVAEATVRSRLHRELPVLR
jgi:uncharacterized membrane protein